MNHNLLSKPLSLILGTGLIASLLLLFFFNPSQHGFYPICQFHSMTGLYCPGCGCLRATHQLLHGHLGAALHENALLVIALPVLGWRAMARSLRSRGRQSAPISTRKLAPGHIGNHRDSEMSVPPVIDVTPADHTLPPAANTSPFLPVPWLWFGLAAVLLYAVLRNLPFAFFNWLRP